MTTIEYILKANDEQEFKAGRNTKVENVYTYECAAGGHVKFHAHPTKAWGWVIVEANDLGKKHVNRLIDAFCEAGLYRGGKTFEEAIKVLNV
jgi:hypothetical protein